MTSVKPVTLKIHLLTMRGYGMQQELVKSLQHLTCTADDCVLHVSEIENPGNIFNGDGFDVRLHCRRTLQAKAPWNTKLDERYPRHTTYRAVFDNEVTAREIITAIKQLLDTPLLHIRP